MRNLNCVVCNELVDTLTGGGFGFFLTYPRGEGQGHYKAPAFLVHEACARRVAHSEFSFAADATGRPVADPDRWG